MDPVFLTGGIVIVVLAIIAHFKDGYSKRSTAIALLSGAAFIIAGVERSLSDSLIGSLLFITWLLIAIRERLRKT
ncbi:MAG TPA: hypothetical protein VKT72_09930 [Candidatus Baltobacteraceae bacterium]|nr:hypothetical protein [Candidatus Baltobacteraceae bacterium]